MRARDVTNLRHGSKIQLSTRYEEWERGTTARDEQETDEMAGNRRDRTKDVKKLVPFVEIFYHLFKLIRISISAYLYARDS